MTSYDNPVLRANLHRHVMNDSLVNLVSGLGTTQYDKSASNQFTFAPMPPAQANAAYRGDWVARKVVDIPAADATREWRAWLGDKDQVSAIEDEETRLNIQKKVKRALILGRLFGGGVIVIGVKNADWKEELMIESVGRGDLEYVHVADRYEISTGEINRDLLSPYYGEPKYYNFTSGASGAVEVHPSRVIRFTPFEIPLASERVDVWGDSVLDAINAAVKNAALSSEGIATLINEASMDVIRIPEMMANLADAEYRSRLLERFQLAAVGKSMVRSILLDKEEEWDKKQVNFSNLPQIIQTYLQIAAGAGDIPATRLLGQAPSGLNATGDSDIRNYYDNVGANQKNELGPALRRLDEVLIRSALGDRPDDMRYKWNPLWQPTATEQADTMLKKSQAIGNLQLTGLLPDEVLAEGVKGMLLEDELLPGLEGAFDDYDDGDVDETDLETGNQFRRTTTDAAPKTLYVSRQVVNPDAIRKHYIDQGVPEEAMVPADKMHVTVTFSRRAVDWMAMGEGWTGPDGILEVDAGGPRIMEYYGKSDDDLVMLFACHELEWRHSRMRDLGASWDWGEYQPHITIAYGWKPDSSPAFLEDIEPYTGPIHLGPEIFETVDDDWKEKL